MKIPTGRNLRVFGAAAVILLVSLETLDRCFPLPAPGRNSPYAVAVVARDGTPLRAFAGDAPQSFSGYEPGNFQQSFHGPVSVSEALVKSLNVPAVEVLEQLGPARFVAMLRRGGLKLVFPKGA